MSHAGSFSFPFLKDYKTTCSMRTIHRESRRLHSLRHNILDAKVLWTNYSPQLASDFPQMIFKSIPTEGVTVDASIDHTRHVISTLAEMM